jgi:isoleucyl-tRNA synthetase
LGPNILKQTGDLYRRFRNTLRYLLGALDGMSDAEVIDLKDIPELERWVLHRLFEMDTIIRADIEKYEYNHMLQALHHFCALDLSAFYFDIRKDSLYCDAPTSAKRRAVRTVLQALYDHLIVWLAPVLCFTAEEAFLARNKGAEGSIHFKTYPVLPSSWEDAALGNRWSAIRDIRRVVTGAMEIARADKVIGSSLQAAPIVYLAEEQADAIKGLDFAEICISSALIVTRDPAPADAFKLPDVPGVAVTVRLASGTKCERCWQVREDVNEEGLCQRCNQVIFG